MTIAELVDKHFTEILIVLIVIVIIFLVIFIVNLSKISFIHKLWKDAKDIKDPLKLSKLYKRKMMKHSLLFASSTKDNELGYKNIKKYFEIEEEIVEIPLDCNDFDKIFDDYTIIVYKVADKESGRPRPVSDPLYKRISKYCSEQQKYCILVCKPGVLIEISEDDLEFNPIYVTTVQFYSKLKETLYILLYMT